MPETELLGTDGGSMIFRLVVFLYMSSLVKPLELQFVDAVSPVIFVVPDAWKNCSAEKTTTKTTRAGNSEPPEFALSRWRPWVWSRSFFISGSEASNYIGNITLHEKKHDIDIAPWKWMVGIRSFPFEAWDGQFSGAKLLLVSGRVGDDIEGASCL